MNPAERPGGQEHLSLGRIRLAAHAAAAALVLVAAAGMGVACGKKGPPLPPFVRIPAAPADIGAVRRGDVVELTFTVPSANTDGTRPADIERVDLFALSGPRSVSDAEILEFGALVGSLDIKAPADPDDTIDPDEPLSDLEPLEGTGLDQGSLARMTERLTAATMRSVDFPERDRPRAALEPSLGGLPRTTPVIVPAMEVLSRTYVAIGVSTRGRRGAISARAVVPLSVVPHAPEIPEVTYDEQAVTIAWAPVAPGEQGLSSPVLAAHAIIPVTPETRYSVYELPQAGEANASSAGIRLNSDPVTGRSYVDSRIDWGAERCYVVRAVHRYPDGGAVESEASPPACLTLADVFPPAAPAGLQAIASEGAIVLIWNPVPAPDLAGYVVLRGEPGAALRPIAAPPVREATFRDEVPSGRRFVYAVQAVDRAGNVSEASETTEDVAR